MSAKTVDLNEAKTGTDLAERTNPHIDMMDILHLRSLIEYMSDGLVGPFMVWHEEPTFFQKIRGIDSYYHVVGHGCENKLGVKFHDPKQATYISNALNVAFGYEKLDGWFHNCEDEDDNKIIALETFKINADIKAHQDKQTLILLLRVLIEYMTDGVIGPFFVCGGDTGMFSKSQKSFTIVGPDYRNRIGAVFHKEEQAKTIAYALNRAFGYEDLLSWIPS
jgi:hypothetical protein